MKAKVVGSIPRILSITLEPKINRDKVTLEKIGEASNNISQILAVHEERLDTQERERMERRKESDAAVKEVHSRISTASREQQAAISSSEAKVLTEIKLLRTEVIKEQVKVSLSRKVENWAARIRT